MDDAMIQPIPNLSSVEQFVSLKTHVLKTVKEAIITGQLKQGQFYSEVNLAKELGVSRTPIREALTNLEAMRFISIVRGRGFQINSWGPAKVSEIYLYRKMLEMTIIRIVTPKIDESAIKKLNEIQNSEALAIKDGGIRSHQLADRAIHLTLADLTENTFIYSSMESIRDLIEWVSFPYYQIHPDLMERFTNDHKKLIAALKKKDSASAESLMRSHIERGECESIKIYS
jgi:DNA-binding GntR family transcriptional regulator